MAALQTLRRQKQTVETILAENRRLRDQLLEETRFGQDSGGGEDVGDLRTLIAALEARDLSHEAFIAQEQRAVEELIAREEELREEIRKLRLAMGGVFNAKEQWVLRQRRIVLLENQVSRALTGCDTLETRVKQLVREIDGLRKEKTLFNQLQQKLERSLQSKAQHIGELLFLASNAHKSKRRAERLLEKVQLQTDKETAAYMDEWRNLERVLQEDADRREKKYLESCVQRSKRLEAVLAKKRGRRKKGVDSQSHDRTLENKRFPVKSPKERLVQVEAVLAEVVEGLSTECQDAETAIEKFKGLREMCFNLFESLAHTLHMVRTQKEEREEDHGTTSRTIAVKRECSAEENVDPQNVATQISTLSARVAKLCRRYAADFVPPEVLDMPETPLVSNNLLEWLGRLELICRLEFNCGFGCDEETVCDKDSSPAMAGYAPPTLALAPSPRRTSNSSSRSRSSSNFSFARLHKAGKKWKSFNKMQRRHSQGDGLRGLVGTRTDSLPVDLLTLHSRAKQAIAARLRPPIAVRFGDQV